MNHCVLLTRPRGSNGELSRLLKQRGIKSLERPMLEIWPAPEASRQKTLALNLDQCCCVIFVSVNAVHYGMEFLEQYWPQWPQIEWLAVGKATALALEAYGIKAAYPDEAGSEGLLDVEQLQELTNSTVMIVRGCGGRELLATELSSRGAKVSYLEIYQRIELEYREDLISDMFAHGVDIAVATSAQGMQHLLSSIGAQDVAKLHLVVPSKRIGKLAGEMGCVHIHEADGADDDSLLQSILRATLLMQVGEEGDN